MNNMDCETCKYLRVSCFEEPCDRCTNVDCRWEPGDGVKDSDRDCSHCIWHTDGRCASWDCEYISRKEALEAVEKVKELKAELKILADALDGTPLMYPCSKLFEPEGWCKEHCKKFGPTAECWLKYAEMMLEGKK